MSERTILVLATRFYGKLIKSALFFILFMGKGVLHFVIFIALVMSSSFVCGQDLNNTKDVKISSYINDYANLLTHEEILTIEPILKECYDRGDAQYAIVIVNSLNGEDIQGYAQRISEGNLGDSKKNNGLLLLIALQDRQYWFNVGRGLEPVLPDIIVARIGRTYLAPNFKEGNYAKGIREASIAINDRLLNNTDSLYYIASEEEDDESTAGWIVFIIIIIVAIIIITAASKSTKPINGAKKKDNNDYFTAAWILGELMKGGKGGSGGFGGGGFGGFGGGSFGGGGGGGHW
jgi:uncharacterized protein